MTWGKNETLLQLVHDLKRSGIIKSDRIAHVMKLVDRKNYVQANAYDDAPQSIGFNATISAPHMHAYALEYLLPALKPGSKVLDIGSGSGYLCASFGQLVGPTGKVIGIEHVPELVEQSIKNINKDDPSLISNGIVKIIKGDGRFGCPGEGPFDAIHVGAYSSDIPKDLIDQLRPNGRMFIPTGHPCHVQIIEKDAVGNISKHPQIPVAYVPLTSLESQIHR